MITESQLVRSLSVMVARLVFITHQNLGVFLDNAQDLVGEHRPEPTFEQLEQRFNLTVEDCLSHGLTSIHDAGFNPRSLEFFRRYASQSRLAISLVVGICGSMIDPVVQVRG